MSKSISIIKKNGVIQNKDYINKRLEAIYPLLVNGEHTLFIKKKPKKKRFASKEVSQVNCIAV